MLCPLRLNEHTLSRSLVLGGSIPRYGTKNKTTTEQAFFNCNICECELKSVVTLRAHCKGTQHVRKALQKKKVSTLILILCYDS